MSGSRNIKTCKTRGRRGGSVVGERAPDILLCCARRASPAARARDPCGTHAQWRLLCYGFLHMACRHAARLRSCAPFAWRCGTGACTRDLHHPPSCAVQYVATRRRPALHVHNSDGTRDGMPSRFLTADHCVSHHILRSACVMCMCCGVGLSMWQVYLTTPPTSTAFLEYSIFYELRRHRQRHGSLLVLVSFIVHYVGRASYRVHPTSMAMAPQNRKLGNECVHRRIVPVRLCASVRSRWCVCMSDRRRIDVGRFLFIRAM